MCRWLIFYDNMSKKRIIINIDKILYISKNDKDCEIYDVNNNVYCCSSEEEDVKNIFDMLNDKNLKICFL